MYQKITLLQIAVQMGAVQNNFQHALEMMQASLADNPDIIVLPETLNVGFFPKDNLEKLADDNGSTTKEIFGNFAKQHHVNIVAGSVANKKNGRIYNTSYAFDRNGNIVNEYDKVHGFSPAGEHLFFHGGSGIKTFQLDDLNCATIICYDLRFPELVRTAVLQGVDLLFIPAQWPAIRKHHWLTLATARAIENQIFVCAVNGCGYADTTKYGGNSILINPWGETLCQLGESEEMQTAVLDTEIIAGIRSSINVFRDRRSETYKL